MRQKEKGGVAENIIMKYIVRLLAHLRAMHAASCIDQGSYFYTLCCSPYYAFYGPITECGIYRYLRYIRLPRPSYKAEDGMKKCSQL